MAKYTMLLAEYLAKGGALPSSFALIEGFDDLFIAKYCDCEIGYETDELFKIKLEAKAKLVMQMYADRISERAKYWAKVENPTKVYYEKTTIKTNLGEQQRSGNSKTTELPFNGLTAQPNVKGETGEIISAVENNDLRETRKEDNGETIDELLRMLDYLNKDVTTLVEKCLNEFKTLFMGVY